MAAGRLAKADREKNPRPEPTAILPIDADSIERLELDSQGIKQNRDKVFSVALGGPEIYFLLQLLEELAAPNGGYAKVRDSVFFAERIRKRVKEQGF